jgi:hypothetical protein
MKENRKFWGVLFLLFASLSLFAVTNSPPQVTVSADEERVWVKPGKNVKSAVPSEATSVVFTNTILPPDGTSYTDLSNDSDGLVRGWLSGTTYYISSMKEGATIWLNGDSSYMFNEKTNLVSVDFGPTNFWDVNTLNSMFSGCTALQTVNWGTDWHNMDNVTDIMYLFNNCYALTDTGDIGCWNTSKVVNMSQVFYKCYAVKRLDVNGWDLSSCGETEQMFYHTESLEGCLNLSYWNMTSVKNVNGMFEGCGADSLNLYGWSLDSLSRDKKVLIGSDKVGLEKVVYDCPNLKRIYVQEGFALPTSYASETDSKSNTFKNCPLLYSDSLSAGCGTSGNYAFCIDGGWLTAISNPYVTITASAINGTVATPSITLPIGDKVYMAFTPDKSNYPVKQLLVNDVNTVSTNGNAGHTLSLVETDTTVSVEFGLDQTITTSIDNGGTITPTTDVTYATTFDVTWSAANGYYVSKVIVDGVEQASLIDANKTTFTNVTAYHTISVETEKYSSVVTSIDNGGTITASSNVVKQGESYSVTYKPASGYYVSDVIVNNTSNSSLKTNDTYTFTNVTTNQLFTVKTKKYVSITTSITSGAGTITASKSNLQQDSTTKIEYKANSGYYIDSIKVNGSEVSTSTYATAYTVTNPTEDTTIEVTCKKYVTVTVNITNGTGTATTQAKQNTTLPITYKPNDGYYIDSFKVDNVSVPDALDSTEYALFVGTSDITVDIVFAKYISVTTAITNGQITPTSNEIKYGEHFAVIFEADEGYYIAEIRIGKSGYADPDEHEYGYYFSNLTDDTSITVTCLPYLEITTSSSSNGTISESITGIKAGESKKISYAANDGYYLSSLLIDGAEVDKTDYPNDYTFANMTESHTIEAVFSSYSGIRTSVSHGTITPTNESIANGTDFTVEYAPESADYYLYEVLVDGKSVSTTTYDSSYTFTNITSAHTISVVYKKYITITVNAPDTVQATSSFVKVVQDQSYTITYAAKDGYYIESVTNNGTSVDLTKYPSSIVISNPTSDNTVTITANEYYSVTTSKTGSGTITGSSTKIKKGESYKVDYKQAAGYYLAQVLVNGNKVDRTAYASSYTFSNISENNTIDVTFNKLHILTVKADSNNAASIAWSNTSVEDNESSTLTVLNTEQDSYYITDIQLNGTSLGADAIESSNTTGYTYNLTDILQDYTATVTTKAYASYSLQGTGTEHVTVNTNDVDLNKVKEGESVEVTYTPDEGYRIVEFYVNDTDLSNEILDDGLSLKHTFTGGEDANVKLIVKRYYNLTYSITNGSFTNSPAYILEGDTVTVKYNGASNTYLESFAVNGSSVSLNTSSLDNSYVLKNISKDTALTISFETYKSVTTSKTGNGTITAATSILKKGESYTVTYQADSGYYLSKVLVNGSEVSRSTYSTSYTFSNVTKDNTIAVTFNKLHNLTYVQDANNIALIKWSNTSVEDNGTSTLTVKNTNSSDYYITDILLNGTSIGEEAVTLSNTTGYSSTLNNIMQDYEVKVVSESYSSFTLTGEGLDHLNAESECQDLTKLKAGEQADVVFTPEEGYRILGFYVNEEDLSDEILEDGLYLKHTFTGGEETNIKLIVKRYYNLTYKITNGMYTAQPQYIIEGDAVKVAYTANKNTYLKSITLNDESISSGLESFTSEYTLSNITKDTLVTVTFEPYKSITTTKVGNGTITESNTKLKDNSTYDVSYQADTGYYVSSILVDNKEVSIEDYPASYSFKNITANHTIQVTFEKYLSVNVTATNAVVTSSSATIKKGSDYKVEYKADEGYYIESVSVDNKQVNLSKYASSYTFAAITENHTLEVVTNKYLTISTSATNGTIDATLTNLKQGVAQTVNYAPDTGYYISKLVVDGVTVSESSNPSSYTFAADTMTQNHTIAVTFEKFSGIKTSVQHGTITESLSSVKTGENITIEYKPESGSYYLYSVNVDNKSVDIDTCASSYTFTNVTSAHTIEVVYKAYVTLDLSADSTINGGTVTYPTGNLKQDEKQTVSYRADEGYYVHAIVVDGKSLSPDDYPESYTFDDMTQSHTFNVDFRKYLTVETNMQYGTITPTNTKVKQEQDYTVEWTIDTNSYVAAVYIDDSLYQSFVPYNTTKAKSIIANAADDSNETGSYTFSNITESHTITVVDYNYLDIDISAGNCTILTAAPYYNGQDIDIQIDLSDDEYLTKVLVNGKEVTVDENGILHLTNVTDNVSVEVVTSKYLLIDGKKFKEGDSYTYTYPQKEGNYVSEVLVDGNSIDLNKYPTSYTFESITESHTIEVNYHKYETIQFAQPNNGTITADKDLDSLHIGDDVILTFTADKGYYLSKLLIDGEEVDITPTYTFKNLQESHTVEPVFSAYMGIHTEVVNGKITESIPEIELNTDVVIQYQADDGYYLDTVSIDGVVVYSHIPQDIPAAIDDIDTLELKQEDYTSEYIFKDVTESHEILVVYKPYISLTVLSENGTVTSQPKELKVGDTATFQIQMNEGYLLDHVASDFEIGEIVTYMGNTVTIENVQKDHILQVIATIPLEEVSAPNLPDAVITVVTKVATSVYTRNLLPIMLLALAGMFIRKRI